MRLTGLNLISNNGDTYRVVDTSNWSEFLNNTEYMETQYTTLKGSFPTAYNDVALVVDSYNRISTDILDELGIAYTDGSESISYDDLVGKEFKLISNDNYYSYREVDDKKIYSAIDGQSNLSSAYDDGLKVTITAVIRQNEDASSTWVSSGIAYTQALTDYDLDMNADSEIVQYQIANPEYNVLTGRVPCSSSSYVSGTWVSVSVASPMSVTE